jgi:hypothetical protein
MLEYLDEMHRFHPFGQAFPEPVFDFFVFDKEIAYDFFGRPKQHAKIMIDSGIQISMFYQDVDILKDMFEQFKEDDDTVLIFRGTFKYDTYNASSDDDFERISFLSRQVIIKHITKERTVSD